MIATTGGPVDDTGHDAFERLQLGLIAGVEVGDDDGGAVEIGALLPCELAFDDFEVDLRAGAERRADDCSNPSSAVSTTTLV